MKNSKKPEDVIRRIGTIQFQYEKLIMNGVKKQKAVDVLKDQFSLTETTIRRYLKKPKINISE